MVARGKASSVLQPGNHGTTFGGNPLAMRAGIETIRIMDEDKLLQNAADVGEHLKQALKAAFAGEKGVIDVRGQGLMIGVELDRPCGALIARGAEEAHLLFSVTADTVIRLVPALILTRADADEIVARLAPLVKKFLSEGAAQ
ncbi:Acetylornithine aminotransferase [bioreactor metagenome]|uniref:Acetylornithine aminotransferase n=1 Tax=bioreactor metagenome TaxID=1076179 RepID=A0A645FH57_9ZZZZ